MPLPKKMPKYMFKDETHVEPVSVSAWAHNALKWDFKNGFYTDMAESKPKSLEKISTKFEELLTEVTHEPENPILSEETLQSIYAQIFSIPASSVLLPPPPQFKPETPSPVPCRPFGEPSPRKLIL